MKYIITHIALLLFVQISFCQVLETKTSSESLMIGQSITIAYSVNSDVADSIIFQPKKGKIKALAITESGSLSSEGIEFEIIGEFKDTFLLQKSNKKWVGQYVVTAWDSGMYLIPGPDIVINDSTYSFPDISLSCYLSDPIEGLDLYDIRENYVDVPPNPFSLVEFFRSNWWWIIIIIGSLLGYIGYRRYKKHKIEDDEIEDERPISLKQRTLIAIEALEDAKLWEQDRLKEHFVELSYILRSYLTSRYNISLLEKTTYEATIILTQKGLEKETVDVIMRILSQSDMVKFAKSEPDAIAILRVSTLAKQVVAETSPLDFDDAE